MVDFGVAGFGLGDRLAGFVVAGSGGVSGSVGGVVGWATPYTNSRPLSLSGWRRFLVMAAAPLLP